MSQRLNYIDEMKGFAILLVVLGHLFLPHTKEGSLFPTASIIYSFHMSFFFFLSGYVNNLINNSQPKSRFIFFKKKVRSLLIPYLFWLLAAPVFLESSYPSNFTELIEKFIFFPNLHYWFLPTLFGFMMLYLLRSYMKKYDFIFSLCFIGAFMISGILMHQYHLIIYGIYWTSFLLGDSLPKHNKFKHLILKNHIYGISALILCIAWKFYPLETMGSAWKSMTNLILTAICSFSACIFFFNFFQKCTLPITVRKYMQQIGQFSLVIYLIPIHLLPQGFIFSENLPSIIINLSILIIGILHTIISYYIGKIVFCIPYLRYIMFGKI